MTNQERFRRFIELTPKNLTDKTTGKRHPITGEQLIERFTLYAMEFNPQATDEEIADFVAEFEKWLARGDDDGDLPPKAEPGHEPPPEKRKPREPSSGPEMG